MLNIFFNIALVWIFYGFKINLLASIKEKKKDEHIYFVACQIEIITSAIHVTAMCYVAQLNESKDENTPLNQVHINNVNRIDIKFYIFILCI